MCIIIHLTNQNVTSWPSKRIVFCDRIVCAAIIRKEKKNTWKADSHCSLLSGVTSVKTMCLCVFVCACVSDLLKSARAVNLLQITWCPCDESSVVRRFYFNRPHEMFLSRDHSLSGKWGSTSQVAQNRSEKHGFHGDAAPANESVLKYSSLSHQVPAVSFSLVCRGGWGGGESHLKLQCVEMDTLFSEGMRSACLIKESSKIQSHYVQVHNRLVSFALLTSCLKYKEKRGVLKSHVGEHNDAFKAVGILVGPVLKKKKSNYVMQWHNLRAAWVVIRQMLPPRGRKQSASLVDPPDRETRWVSSQIKGKARLLCMLSYG